MRRIYFLVIWLIILSFLPAFAETADHSVFQLRLKPPIDLDQQKILGLANAGEAFGVADITADIVIIEIFSMYCPHCQREAPLLNDFYDTLIKQAKPDQRIVMIGIGVGNSDYEVQFFKNQYQVRFPLFADIDYAMYKLLDGPKTPHFIGIRLKDKTKDAIFYDKAGGIQDYPAFLRLIFNQFVPE